MVRLWAFGSILSSTALSISITPPRLKSIARPAVPAVKVTSTPRTCSVTRPPSLMRVTLVIIVSNWGSKKVYAENWNPMLIAIK